MALRWLRRIGNALAVLVLLALLAVVLLASWAPAVLGPPADGRLHGHWWQNFSPPRKNR